MQYFDSKYLSKRAIRLRPSPTIFQTKQSTELQKKGVDVINLASGEPLHAPPLSIIPVIKERLDKGMLRYTATPGTDELRRSIIHLYKKRWGLEFSTQEVMACTGAKQAISQAFLATIDPEDEVIIPVPYWPSFSDMVEFADGKAIYCNSTDYFTLDIEHFKKLLTSKTKWLLLNTPGNPAGNVYSLKELKKIGKILLDWPNVLILSDEVYGDMVWDSNKSHVPFIRAVPELKSRTLTINSLSKSYSMPGWRLGFAAGPAELISTMTKIQDQLTANPNLLSQIAASEALAIEPLTLSDKNIYIKNMEFLINGLNETIFFKCSPVSGGIFAFIKCDALIGVNTVFGVIKNDQDVSSWLLQHAYVNSVPGSVFGLNGYIRMSFAHPLNKIEEAVCRIKEAIKQIR
ncbi:MAG: aminotransferase class I/II-fold pyridoxal phosphate-dependent enzyme [Rhizobiales bacterium]|nr:aminotransferase class I/II-fold pyridoxal phosphate-dependent enzyme [Hyphomicrobiales bacterium]